MNAVAFVPIRLNSKRVKNKNLRVLKGRPLFCHCLSELDKLSIPVYVYSNWDEVLMECLDFESKNIHFLKRPDRLDGDDVKGIDIYGQFAKDVPADVYLLAHCTSPYVEIETYRKSLNSVLQDGYDSSMTVERIQTFAWYKNKPLNFTPPRPQTQLLDPIFIETSACYCYTKEVLKKGARTSETPKLIETQYPETIDIDTETDFKVAEHV